MKFLVCIFALLALPALSYSADQSDADNQVIIKSESQSVFKGLLYKVWGKLRALSPSKPARQRNRATVTAGIRGAETTGSLLEPYWMGDRTDDPDYINELNAYTRAQQLAEAGDLGQAVTALTAFIEEHQASDLKPNALFALGLSYAGQGQNQPGVEALQSFLDDYPKHPLAADARQVIAELR